MIFFCRKTSTADGRTRWSVCVPTLMGFTTIAWFYSEDLADNFIRHLENSEEDRHLASLDAWREFQFRLDFIWSEKLQQDRGLLENHWQDISASMSCCAIRPVITAKPSRPSGMKVSRSWVPSPAWKSWPRPCISKAVSSTASRRRSRPGSSKSCRQHPSA